MASLLTVSNLLVFIFLVIYYPRAPLTNYFVYGVLALDAFLVVCLFFVWLLEAKILPSGRKMLLYLNIIVGAFAAFSGETELVKIVVGAVCWIDIIWFVGVVHEERLKNKKESSRTSS